VIPRLDAAPKLDDFLAFPLGGPATKMLRVASFVERYPNDGMRLAKLP